jgi:biopolymer transport protein ExbD
VLNRPSSRRKGEKPQINLNLVPILDSLVTLISFLMFTMSFMSLVSVETPFPTASVAQNEKKLKEKPLQLTVSVREQDLEIWSPFNRVASTTIRNVEDGKPNTAELHSKLIEIKQKYPKETQVVFVPTAAMNYDTMVALMDAMRVLEATDPPIFAPNAETGVDEAVKALFPEVVFGNLLGIGREDT